jgi:hypothetical protein
VVVVTVYELSVLQKTSVLRQIWGCLWIRTEKRPRDSPFRRHQSGLENLTRCRLAKRNRLAHTVVCSAIQGDNPIFDPWAGGQHENRKLRFDGPYAAQQRNAVEPGEAHIENKEIIIKFRGTLSAPLAIRCHIYRVALRLQDLSAIDVAGLQADQLSVADPSGVKGREQGAMERGGSGVDKLRPRGSVRRARVLTGNPEAIRAPASNSINFRRADIPGVIL